MPSVASYGRLLSAQTWKREQRMDVIKTIYHRRSVRSYKPDVVSREIIDELIAAAVQAPSAMNLQPWAFIVVEGRELLSDYAERAKQHLLASMTPQSPLDRYRDQLAEPSFDIFYGAPALVVIAATSDTAQSADDCCMAAQNLMLLACNKGLGTCCIGFARPWLNLSNVKDELGLPRRYAPVLAIVIGYPSGVTPPVPRKVPEVRWVGRTTEPGNGSGGRASEAESEQLQQQFDFEEPAVTEAFDDPGTDVAPSRYDEPLDPLAPRRVPSPETCGPLSDEY
jgi:nitroreductase